MRNAGQLRKFHYRHGCMREVELRVGVVKLLPAHESLVASRMP